VSTQFLIADDNPHVRLAIRKMLEAHEGFTVCSEAANGAEAIAKALELQPNFVLLDMVMPEMNGMQAAEEIHRLLPSSPIVMCTMLSKQFLESSTPTTAVRAIIEKAELADKLIPVIEGILAESAAPKIKAEQPTPAPKAARPATNRA
jgi:DNA-binding NarL/FixJ family response regulator